MPAFLPPAPWNISRIEFVSDDPLDSFSLSDARIETMPKRPHPPYKCIEALRRVGERQRRAMLDLQSSVDSYYANAAEETEPPKSVRESTKALKRLTRFDSELEKYIRLYEMPFERIERYPRLVRYASLFINIIDDFRKAHGELLPVDRVYDFIYLVEASNFDRALEQKGARKRVTGWHDKINGITFVRYDAEEGSAVPCVTPQLLGVLAHELAHSGMVGITPFSSMLDEGVTEKIARYINPLGTLMSGYQDQVDFLYFVQHDSPETYDALIRAAFIGNYVSAREAIEERYGAELADMIEADPMDWSHILQRFN